MTTEFRAAIPSDLEIILEHVRQENLAEVELAGFGIEEALAGCLERSAESWVAVIDGDPVCAFGVCPTDYEKMGQPWMIGTSLIDRHAVEFLRGSKAVIKDILTRWDYLANIADPRNKRGLRWLRFMGFTIYPAEPYGKNGEIYHAFELIKKKGA